MLLTIHAPTDAPDDIYEIRKHGWSGKILHIAKAFWSAMDTGLRAQLQAAGVYILLGDAGDSDGKQTVYIGQAGDLFARIGQHIANPDMGFFRRVVCILDAGFNDAHFRWMEADLIGKAGSYGQCRLQNGNTPNKPSLGAEADSVREFLQTTLTILPIVTGEIFVEPKAITRPDVPKDKGRSTDQSGQQTAENGQGGQTPRQDSTANTNAETNAGTKTPPTIIDPPPAPPLPAGMRPYVAFEGPAGPAPRQATTAEIAEGLYRIIAIEGPIRADRAYRVYLSGCGIPRLNSGNRHALNRALQRLISNLLIIKHDEGGQVGFLYSVVHTPDTPAVVIRARGPRAFADIPQSELYLVARRLMRDSEFEWADNAHRRAVFARYEMHHPTPTEQTRLGEILGRAYPHADALFERDG